MNKFLLATKLENVISVILVEGLSTVAVVSDFLVFCLFVE